MIIDAHVHLWNRMMLPNEAVKNYLEPLKNMDEELRKFFDFGLDNDIAFDDFSISAEELLKEMSMSGVDKAVILSTDFELLNDSELGNEEYTEMLFQECSVFDELIPFISVDPNRGEEGLRMVERMVKKYAPSGIKMYPATGFYPDKECYADYWDLIDDLGLVVLTHAGMALPPLDEKYCRPCFFRDVADSRPDLKVIIAHLGGKFYDELLPLMRDCSNVYTDCSALQGWLPSQPDMVHSRLSEVCGEFPDRVVFGSDFPNYEIRFSTLQFINLIRSGDWADDKVKKKLLGSNMARILGL